MQKNFSTYIHVWEEFSRKLFAGTDHNYKRIDTATAQDKHETEKYIRKISFDLFQIHSKDHFLYVLKT